MNRHTAVIVTSVICVFYAIGCSGGGTPVSPGGVSGSVVMPAQAERASQTHLWGLYDVHLDIPSKTAVAVPNRQAIFTANVVNFINSKPTNLGFHINGTSVQTDYIDVDINVTITHPFPGLPQYNGYDVRGVFMGDGSAYLHYNNALVFPVLGTDQFMLPDPTDTFGGPDGYTRWFNFTEFFQAGMPLFQYTQGKNASPGFAGTATLNPYKYFADGLQMNDDLWTWLGTHAGQNGQFSSGASNTRNYYLRFPNSKGIVFAYAVIADWSGTEPQFHPSNAPEAVALSVVDSSDVFYISPAQKGGSIKLDVGVWNWSATLSGPAMDDHKIFVESTVLSSPYEFTTNDMTPVGGDENFSTYHVEIPADNIPGKDGNEYWVIVEEKDIDYTNPYDVPNAADGDRLAAFFRYDLPIGGTNPASIHVTSPNGGESFIPSEQVDITWTSSYVTGTVFLEYSWDNFASNIHSIETGVPNTGTYQWTVPCAPSNTLRVRVSSTSMPYVNDTSDADFTIIGNGWGTKWGDTGYEEGRAVAFDSSDNIYIAGTTVHVSTGRNWGFVAKFDPCGQLQWSKSWGGLGLTQGYGVAVDSTGNVYTTGNFYGTCDFDPDNPGGPGFKTSVGGSSWDAWLNVFDSNGNFKWVRTWGGGYSDSGQNVCVDSSDGIYVSGFFCWTVDFDPDGGDSHQSNASSFDPFVCKYDSTGDFKWARTWGSPLDDRAWGVAAGGGNVYVTGYFQDVNVNFNPDGSTLLSSNGGEDVFLSAFSASGAFQWAKSWGGTAAGIMTDEGMGVAADISGNAYCTGYYFGTNVNFNPDGSDPHSTPGSGPDSFLSKWSASGVFQWARTWGGAYRDAGEGAAVDASGNVFVTGWFYGSANFNPGGSDQRTALGSYEDAYLSKFDSGGNYQWVHSYGSTNNDRGLDVNVDDQGNICATGFFNGPANLAPADGGCSEPPDNVSPAGGADAFLIRYLPDGCW